MVTPFWGLVVSSGRRIVRLVRWEALAQLLAGAHQPPPVLSQENQYCNNYKDNNKGKDKDKG